MSAKCYILKLKLTKQIFLPLEVQLLLLIQKIIPNLVGESLPSGVFGEVGEKLTKQPSTRGARTWISCLEARGRRFLNWISKHFSHQESSKPSVYDRDESVHRTGNSSGAARIRYTKPRLLTSGILQNWYKSSIKFSRMIERRSSK